MHDPRANDGPGDRSKQSEGHVPGPRGRLGSPQGEPERSESHADRHGQADGLPANLE